MGENSVLFHICELGHLHLKGLEGHCRWPQAETQLQTRCFLSTSVYSSLRFRHRYSFHKLSEEENLF